MSDRIFAVIWALLCIGGLIVGWQIHSEYSYEPVGPRPFPVVIMALMLLCSLMLLVRRPEKVDWPSADYPAPPADYDAGAGDLRLEF
jgi:putative tricarboxylic transport membrane protein